ncbi:metallopeptidase family protein [uncultured Peptoniphilus sp.]|uniref:metallopeptidase family protein n=1 Tax=uncultured Peptoniphilus sp. TaxID=254354 RepID=UPI0025865137|nr:metallopeptidase family protein [uncultured Peptoniphilus sp.]MDU6784104.1 metallopeptidase family protein [Peptoniphilus harei]
MPSEKERKIFFSDYENNIDLPLDLIEDIYVKREEKIDFKSSDEDSREEENFTHKDLKESQEENPEEVQKEDKEVNSEENQNEVQDDNQEDEDLFDENKYDSYYLERIDEVEEILEEICESIPSYAYEHLNGGIILTEERKFHQESYAEDLLIMGEYQRSILGNMIKIYYGSFMDLYRFSPRERLKEKLEEVLLHEFTHHLEFLANEWGLVIEDNKFLEEYRKRKQNE